MSQTRAQIETQIASYLDRTDLTASISFWFEVAYLSLLRKIRHNTGQRTSSIAMVALATSYAMPTNVKKPRLFYSYDTVNSKLLDFYNLTSIEELRTRRVTEDPDLDPTITFDNFLSAVWADKIEIHPATPSDVTSKEFRLDNEFYLTPQVSGSDNVTDTCFDYLIYRSLVESSPFLAGDSRILVWKGMADAALTEIFNSQEYQLDVGETVMKG